MDRRLFGIVVVMGLAGGCGTNSAAHQEVRSAASRQLACDEESIGFVVDKPHEKEVRGCGRSQRYMYRCKSVSRHGGTFGGQSSPSGVQECKWAAVGQ